MTTGVICDVEHYFCSCSRVSYVWGWLRARLVGLLGDASVQVSGRDKKATWLVGTYLTRV